MSEGFAALLDTLASLGLPAENALPSGNIGKLPGKFLPSQPAEEPALDDVTEPASASDEVEADAAALSIDPMPPTALVMVPVPATRLPERAASAATDRITSQATGHSAPPSIPSAHVGPSSAPALPMGVMQVGLARIEVIEAGRTSPVIQQGAIPIDGVLAGKAEKSQVLPTNLPPTVPVTGSQHDIAPIKPELLPLTRTLFERAGPEFRVPERGPPERAAPVAGVPTPRSSLEPSSTLEATGKTALPSPAATTSALLDRAPPFQPLLAATGSIGGAMSLPPTSSSVEMPQDFAALVGRLSEARQEASPHLVRTALNHEQFGPVSLEFRHEERGLAVTLSSAAPGFGGSVQTAVAAALANAAQNGDPPREGGHQAPAHQQIPSGNFGASAGTDQRQQSAGSDRPPPSGWLEPDREQGNTEDRGSGGAGHSDIYA